MRVSFLKLSPTLQTRVYTTRTSLNPRKTGARDPTRPYQFRKAYLYDQYTALLSESQVILFLRHSNFSVSGLSKVRRDITTAGASKKGKEVASLESVTTPCFEVIRPGIFGAALRERVGRSTSDYVASLLTGQVALLSLPSLNPPQLSTLIRIIERAAPPVVSPALNVAVKPPENDWEEAAAPAPAPPSISLLGALIEDRPFFVDGLKEVGKLPTLDNLRAQIVQLLSSPAVNLVRTLESAGGSNVARTLEGFKKGLEEQSSS